MPDAQPGRPGRGRAAFRALLHDQRHLLAGARLADDRHLSVDARHVGLHAHPAAGVGRRAGRPVHVLLRSCWRKPAIATATSASGTWSRATQLEDFGWHEYDCRTCRCARGAHARHARCSCRRRATATICSGRRRRRRGDAHAPGVRPGHRLHPAPRRRRGRGPAVLLLRVDLRTARSLHAAAAVSSTCTTSTTCR